MPTAGPPPCTEDGLPDPGPLTPERIARIAKALAHPARVQFVSEFAGCLPLLAGELVATSDLAQSTVSEHLRILRNAGVGFARQDGPRSWYCLRRPVLGEFAAAVGEMAAARSGRGPHPAGTKVPVAHRR